MTFAGTVKSRKMLAAMNTGTLKDFAFAEFDELAALVVGMKRGTWFDALLATDAMIVKSKRLRDVLDLIVTRGEHI